ELRPPSLSVRRGLLRSPERAARLPPPRSQRAAVDGTGPPLELLTLTRWPPGVGSAPLANPCGLERHRGSQWEPSPPDFSPTASTAFPRPRPSGWRRR